MLLHPRLNRKPNPSLLHSGAPGHSTRLPGDTPTRRRSPCYELGPLRTRTWRLSTMSRHRSFSSCSRGVGTVQDAMASAPSRHITRAQITSPWGAGSTRRSSKSTFSPEEILLATRVRGGPPHAWMNWEAYSRASLGQRLTVVSEGMARTYARDRLSGARNSARDGEGVSARQSVGTSRRTITSREGELSLWTGISTERFACTHETKIPELAQNRQMKTRVRVGAKKIVSCHPALKFRERTPRIPFTYSGLQERAKQRTPRGRLQRALANRRRRTSRELAPGPDLATAWQPRRPAPGVRAGGRASLSMPRGGGQVKRTQATAVLTCLAAVPIAPSETSPDDGAAGCPQ